LLQSRRPVGLLLADAAVEAGAFVDVPIGAPADIGSGSGGTLEEGVTIIEDRLNMRTLSLGLLSSCPETSRRASFHYRTGPATARPVKAVRVYRERIARPLVSSKEKGL
jgi:hypothetical protein